MRRRYRMQKGPLFVETAFTDKGKSDLEWARRLRPDLFKRARILDVLQAQPDAIKCGRLYHSDIGEVGSPADLRLTWTEISNKLRAKGIAV